ncbi:hypothetical protein C4D60_Mb11t20680 [Musa balbisiana]|uniref:CHL-CPN10 n=1 Tax=Musa balbisiana TaxID=52838 RepID=A0A4S8J5J7_MUSBA|nr:hypothetical protein C4D60_Mb11t20680 [Musa balbisiana]
MASSVLAAAKPLLHPSHPRTPPPSRVAGGPSLRWSLPASRRSAALRVHALKCEPSKIAPQADRVLVRLEELPEILSVGSDVTEVEAGKKVLFSDINAYEVDLGTDTKHCFCKASDLLAVVE